MNRLLISLENVAAAYDGKQVLSDVNLKVREKDFIGIIGPNGGGKTTLVKLILGLISPTAGKIDFYKEGKPVDKIKIGYLPQYSSLDKKFPISLFELVLSGLSGQKPLFHPFDRNQRDMATETIRRMGMEGLEQAPVGTLSGGQLQRALLGRAIVSSPDVVILDEPSTYLDKRFEEHLYPLLEEINRKSAILLVSHDIGTILQNVKSVACVNETLDYHPDTEISSQKIEAVFGCPIDLLGHGEMPHRILKRHSHEAEPEKR